MKLWDHLVEGEGTEHRRGKQAAIAWLKAQGFDAEPEQVIPGLTRRPDVWGKRQDGAAPSDPALKDVDEVVIEVEGDLSPGSSATHAQEQMKAFTGWAGKGDRRLAILLVPKGNCSEAQNVLPLYPVHLQFARDGTVTPCD